MKLIRIADIPYAVNSCKVISVGITPTGTQLAVCLEGMDSQVELDYADPEQASNAFDDFIEQFNEIESDESEEEEKGPESEDAEPVSG